MNPVHTMRTLKQGEFQSLVHFRKTFQKHGVKSLSFATEGDKRTTVLLTFTMKDGSVVEHLWDDDCEMMNEIRAVHTLPWLFFVNNFNIFIAGQDLYFDLKTGNNFPGMERNPKVESVKAKEWAENVINNHFIDITSDATSMKMNIQYDGLMKQEYVFKKDKSVTSILYPLCDLIENRPSDYTFYVRETANITSL